MEQRNQELRIHLIDNDSAILLSLFDHLSSAGFQVAASSNATDALAAIGRIKPEVVIASVELTDVPGFEILDRVREVSPRTRIVLMASGGGWTEYEEAKKRGALDFLIKPCRTKAVLRTLESLSTGPSGA